MGTSIVESHIRLIGTILGSILPTQNHIFWGCPELLLLLHVEVQYFMALDLYVQNESANHVCHLEFIELGRN